MRTRMHHISVWLNDRELSRLKELSEKSGLKTDPLLRSLIMGQQLHSRPTEEYRQLLRELSAIGNNINQIARIANTVGHIELEEIRRAADAINEFRTRIREVP